MTQPHPITESDLHAFADGQLPAERRALVEDWLRARPEELARVEAWARDSAALREHFAGVVEEPIPVRIPTRRPRGVHGPAWTAWAAAAAVGAIGISLGWYLRGELAPTVAASMPAAAAVRVSNAEFARRAAVAHGVYSPEVRRPVEVSAEQEGQLVTWLSKRMEAPMKPPHLGGAGYELVGGRLLPGARGPAAQFMYQDASGQRLTLYVARETGPGGKDTAFRFEQSGGVNVFYWIDGPFGYALSAGIDRGTLQKVAVEVYRQLQN